MKMKNLIIVFLFLSLAVFSFADDKTDNYKVSGLDVFFKQNINQEISVSIANMDITITGELIAVYYDSIVVRSFSKDVLISKIYIAFVKAKTAENGK